MRKHQPTLVLLATLMFIILPASAFIATRHAPAWIMMWAIAIAIFAACKLLTLATTPIGAPLGRIAAYLFAWPGLDADSFLASGQTPGTAPHHGAAHDLMRFAVGAFVVIAAAWGVMRHDGSEVPDEWSLMPVTKWTGAVWQEWALGWVAMVGIVLILHFGLFGVLARAWQWAGVNARTLMDRPLAAKSIGEFWGRRWNTAFRDITHAHLFTPLSRLLGPRWAIVVGFVISGLVHELVITVPARAGYGLPTLFFAWQGVAMLLERTRPMRRVRSRIWTLACLAPAIVILFPPVFVERVIVPMLRAIGQLSM